MSAALALPPGADVSPPPAAAAPYRPGAVIQVAFTRACAMPVALTPRCGTMTLYGPRPDEAARRLCQALGRRPRGLTVRGGSLGQAAVLPAGDPFEPRDVLAEIDSPDPKVRAALPETLNVALHELAMAGWWPDSASGWWRDPTRMGPPE